jgi:hypothetical protein
MVMKWSWGDETPQEIQHMASLVLQDLMNMSGPGLDMSLLQTLAGIGAAGSSPQHSHKELLERLPPSNLPSMQFLPVPLEHDVFGVSCADSGVIWPHELFSALYHQFRDLFFTYIIPSMSTLHDFWDQVRGSLRMA